MVKKRVLYFDLLNILACFGVVCIHQNGIIYRVSVYNRSFCTAMIAETFFYWAVPVFFMLSGANLMGYRKKYSTREFIAKRLKRVLIPFIVFSLIQLVWKYAEGIMFLDSYSPVSVYNAVILTKTEGTYWFFVPILAVYFCMPVLSLLKDNKRILWYMFGMAFITISVMPLLSQLLKLGWNSGFTFPMTAGYVMFAIEGYLLADTEFSGKQRNVIYVLAILSLALRYGGTLWLSQKTGSLDKTFFGYMQFHSVFLATGVFVLFRSIKWDSIFKSRKICSAVSSAAGCSFGIYLIHMIVMYYVQDFSGADPESILYRTLGCIVTYMISFVIVYAVKRIPFIGKVMP